MTTINRKCAYPDINPTLRLTNGQLPMKNHIQQFDQLLKDIGLLRTATVGQLDTTNIPDLDLTQCFSNLSAYWNYNTTQAVFYAPLEYSFDDSLQATNPVVIKFEFFYFRPEIRTVLNTLEMPHFGVKITISGQTNTIVLWQVPSFVSPTVGSTYSQSFPIGNYYTMYANQESYICYDKLKGYLYINYCPSFKYSLTAGTSSYIPLKSSVHLLISRSRDNTNSITNSYIKVIGQVPNTLYTSTITNYGGGSIYNLTDSSCFYFYISPYSAAYSLYQSDVGFQTPLNATVNYNNGRFYTYMTMDYDGSNTALKYDPYVLIGHKDMSTARTGLIYSIKINDTETKNFLCISQADTGGYPYSANQVLLVYYN